MTDDDTAPDDGTSVRAVLQGDTESFAHIVRRYQSALLRVAFSRLGNAELAEDAVQESFMSAFKSLSSYDSQYSFRTWLWTILLNQCRRQYRQQCVRLAVEQAVRDRAEIEQRSLEPVDLAKAIDGLESREMLERFLAGLPEAQADALRLRFFGDLKFQEIAHTMQCSLSAAKLRVRRGLESLSELIAANRDSNTNE